MLAKAGTEIGQNLCMAFHESARAYWLAAVQPNRDGSHPNGLPGLMRGARIEELAFADGRGPDPATRDHATFINGDENDPLATPLQ